MAEYIIDEDGYPIYVANGIGDDGCTYKMIDDCELTFHRINADGEVVAFDRHIESFFHNVPTFAEAKLWSTVRLRGGPMTEHEFVQYMRMGGFTYDEAMDHNRLRSLTTFGWYILLWIQHIKWSFK